MSGIEMVRPSGLRIRNKAVELPAAFGTHTSVDVLVVHDLSRRFNTVSANTIADCNLDSLLSSDGIIDIKKATDSLL